MTKAPLDLHQIHLSKEVLALKPELLQMRRHLHQYPELGLQEKKTSQFIAERLNRYGYAVRQGVAQTGVIGLLQGKGGKGERTLLLRADMDGLPIPEETHLPYQSRNKGVMHACGHDAHVSILLGTAQLLASTYREHLRGSLKLMFQPAEESPGGAKPMIEEGLLKNPPVTLAAALHLWNELPVGYVGVQSGPVFASSDRFDVTLIGKGGHGAMPHLSIDPIVIGAQLIGAYQTVVSREMDPQEPVVVTVGKIQSGYNFNVIPEHLTLSGTVRTYNSTLRSKLPKILRRITQHLCAAWKARYTFNYTFQYPPTVNDHAASDLVQGVASEVVGEKHINNHCMTMGAEDMSYVLEKVPGCYFFLGSANPEKGLTAPHHSSHFNFDEKALLVGTEIFSRLALGYLT